MAHQIVPPPVHLEKNMNNPSPVTPGKQRILVMDDEETIRLMLDKLLGRLGYDVETVTNGEEAIELYKEAYSLHKPFHLVIMDLTIPGSIGGKEAITQFKEFDPNTNAVIISGYSTDPMIVNYGDYGFSGVIKKPFQFDELREVLDSVL